MELYILSPEEVYLRKLLISFKNKSLGQSSSLSVSELSSALLAVSEEQRYFIVKSQFVLHQAVRFSENLDLVKCLLDHLAPEHRQELLFMKDGHGKTTLHYASESGSVEKVKYVLDSTAPEKRQELLTTVDNEGKTSLHYASELGSVDTVKYILGSTTSQNRQELLLMQDHEGKTSLHYASWLESVDTVKYILDCIEPENRMKLLMAKDNEGKASLHCASWSASVDTVKYILDSTAPENRQRLLMMQGKDGKTSLHYASFLGSVDIVKCIMDTIAPENRQEIMMMKDDEGKTPLHYVSKSGSANNIVKYLLDSTASNNRQELLIMKDNEGMTSLHYVSWSDSADTVKYIVDSIVPEHRQRVFMMQDHKGKTSLHYAAELRSVDTAKYILDSMTPGDRQELLMMKDDDGNTSLHCATKSLFSPTCISPLLQHLTPQQQIQLLDATNNDGKTAQDLTISGGSFWAKEILKEYQQQSQIAIFTRSTGDAPGTKANDDMLTLLQISRSAFTPRHTSALPVQRPILPAVQAGNNVQEPMQSPSTESLSQSWNASGQWKQALHSIQQPWSVLPPSSLFAASTDQVPMSNVRPSAFSTGVNSSYPNFTPSSLPTSSEQRVLPMLSAGSISISPNQMRQTLPQTSTYQPLYNLPSAPEQLQGQISGSSSLNPTQTLSNLWQSLAQPSTPQPLHPSYLPMQQQAQPSISSSHHSVQNFSNPQPATSRYHPLNETTLHPSPPQRLESTVSHNTGVPPSTIAGYKRIAPIDLSNQQASAPAPPKITRYEGKVEGETIELKYNNEGFIFMFPSGGTIREFVSQVEEATGCPCTLRNTGGFKYANSVILRAVAVPFLVTVGDSETLITSRSAPVETAVASTSGSNTARQSETTQNRQRFGRMSNAEGVVELFNFVHEQVISGKSINSALKMSGKDRKTIDRFRNIYYLHVTNSDRLKELEQQWLRSHKQGALPGLNEMARREIDWILLKRMADEGNSTLFGGVDDDRQD